MPGFADSSASAFLEVLYCFSAGDNLGNKFPARATFSQMRYDKFAHFNWNPVIYKGSSIFATRVPRFFLVSTLARHVNSHYLGGWSTGPHRYSFMADSLALSNHSQACGF